jgi:hypothetical protein
MYYGSEMLHLCAVAKVKRPRRFVFDWAREGLLAIKWGWRFQVNQARTCWRLSGKPALGRLVASEYLLNIIVPICFRLCSARGRRLMEEGAGIAARFLGRRDEERDAAASSSNSTAFWGSRNRDRNA